MKDRAPSHLSREARQIWKSLVEEYGINDAGGLEILKTGLEARDRFTGARVKINADGMTIFDRHGTEKGHPLLAAERDARAQWLAALKMLNLDVEPLRDGPGRPPGS
jgi:P27 family predicted phage terminase small subunit